MRNQKEIHGDHVLLYAARTRLLVPQAMVGPIEHLDHRCALAVLGGQDGLLAALSEDLEVMDAIPPDRRLATTLAGRRVRWCWSEVRVLRGLRLSALPLPPVVAGLGSPATHFCVVQGEIAVVPEFPNFIASLERDLIDLPL